jgi:hypothetical protein
VGARVATGTQLVVTGEGEVTLVLFVTGARYAVLVGSLIAGAALVLAGTPVIVVAKGLLRVTGLEVTGTARLTGEAVTGPLVMGARLTGEPVAGALVNGTMVVGAVEGARFCGEPGPILQSTSSNNKRRPVILAM